MAKRVPRRMEGRQPWRDAHHVALEWLEATGFGQDLHDPSAAVACIGVGDKALPVSRAVPHDGVV